MLSTTLILTSLLIIVIAPAIGQFLKNRRLEIELHCAIESAEFWQRSASELSKELWTTHTLLQKIYVTKDVVKSADDLEEHFSREEIDYLAKIANEAKKSTQSSSRKERKA